MRFQKPLKVILLCNVLGLVLAWIVYVRMDAASELKWPLLIVLLLVVALSLIEVVIHYKKRRERPELPSHEP